MEKQQYDDSEVIQHVSELMTELVNVDTAGMGTQFLGYYKECDHGKGFILTYLK